MKKIIFCLVAVCLCASAYSQETLYIRDTLYVVLRSDLSDQSEVVFSGLVSGTPVTLVEESADELNSKVRTEDGTEGWIQTQYLSEDTATKKDLQQANEKLVQLETENAAIQQQLDGLNESRFSEVEGIIAEKDATFEQNKLLQSQLEAVRTENSELKSAIKNDNYLNGAYAVLMGVFLTLIIPMFKRKKSTEWA